MTPDNLTAALYDRFLVTTKDLFLLKIYCWNDIRFVWHIYQSPRVSILSGEPCIKIVVSEVSRKIQFQWVPPASHTGIAFATSSRRRSWRRGSCSPCTCTTTFCRGCRRRSSAARPTCSSPTSAGQSYSLMESDRWKIRNLTTHQQKRDEYFLSHN